MNIVNFNIIATHVCAATILYIHLDIYILILCILLKCLKVVEVEDWNINCYIYLYLKYCSDIWKHD